MPSRKTFRRKKKKPLDSTFDNSKQMKLTASHFDGCLTEDETKKEEKEGEEEE